MLRDIRIFSSDNVSLKLTVIIIASGVDESIELWLKLASDMYVV